MRSRVLSVDDVQLSLTKSKPPQLLIHAAGTVTSSGWTAPELSPWIHIAPPADGLINLDFTAEQPVGRVLTVILPISANVVMPVPDWVQGVRVHSSTNSVEKRLTEASDKAVAGGGDPHPWPWFVEK